MYKNNEFKLLLIPFIIIVLTIFLPMFNINLLFAGVSFLFFLHSIEKKQFILTFFLIVANFFIEANNSFDILSLSIISTAIYLIFYKKIIYFLSIDMIQKFILIVLFYFILFLYLIFLKNYNIDLFSVLLLNIFIDFIISSFL